MIVVDVNVLAYLYLPGPFTTAVEKLLLRDAQWAAPRLWRSEFRHILATYMRKNLLTLEQANCQPMNMRSPACKCCNWPRTAVAPLMTVNMWPWHGT